MCFKILYYPAELHILTAKLAIAQANHITNIQIITYIIVFLEVLITSSSQLEVRILNQAYIIYITAISVINVNKYFTILVIFSTAVHSVSTSFIDVLTAPTHLSKPHVSPLQ
ncbi:MAG: hypothetical protein Q9M97_01610 [Candidatus Gracilibacteria bacterium]|nr:hypothetical protein [Candidatus Gracilibacteria bacterium]